MKELSFHQLRLSHGATIMLQLINGWLFACHDESLKCRKILLLILESSYHYALYTNAIGYHLLDCRLKNLLYALHYAKKSTLFKGFNFYSLHYFADYNTHWPIPKNVLFLCQLLRIRIKIENRKSFSKAKLVPSIANVELEQNLFHLTSASNL